MARKARRRKENPRALLNLRQLEKALLSRSFPRLQMSLILALAAVGAFLSSALLVALGMTNMAGRYALASFGGYFTFLGCVRLWIAYQTRHWSFGRSAAVNEGSPKRSDGGSELPDLSALADLGGAAEAGFSGGGGEFGGAGASDSFGEVSTGEGTSTDVLDGLGGGDGEGIAIVVAVVALLGGLLALGFVVYSSPILLAEVLLDVAVVGSLYRKNRKYERGHWAKGVLRRTYKPMLVLAAFAAIFGFAVQSLAPTEHTLGAVLQAQTENSK